MTEYDDYNNAAFKTFYWIDYAVFIGALLVFVGVALYSTIRSRKEKSKAETELIGNKKFHILPVTLAVMASYLSAISLLGFTSEIYTYGTMLIYYALMYCIAFPCVAIFFLPVFYELKLTSLYQYLELRFSKTVRTIASVMFCMQMTLYMGAVLYAPALALASVTPLTVTTSILLTGCIGTAYTSLGGARAVIFTSAVQMIIIFGGMIVVMVIGGIKLGGIQEALSIANNGLRLQFTDFRIDPHVRHSFWSLVIGGTFMICALYGTSQMSVQRYIAMPTLKDATKILLINVPLNMLIMFIYVIIGIIIYATYQNPYSNFCDPQHNKQITKNDQLLPFFVMDKMNNLYGVPGLFVAAIYSAGFSTLASGINAVSAVIYGDFVAPFQKTNAEKHGAMAVRIIAICIGVISIGIAFICSMVLPMVLQLSLTIFGLFGGPILGVFTLGIFVPFANRYGAIAGLIIGTILNLFIGFGAMSTSVRVISLPIQPVNSTETCLNLDNNLLENYTYEFVLPETYNLMTVDAPTPIFDISTFTRISYQYYSLIGCLSCLFIGVAISLITNRRRNSNHVPKLLLSPFLRSKYGHDISKKKIMNNESSTNFEELKDLTVELENMHENGTKI